MKIRKIKRGTPFRKIRSGRTITGVRIGRRFYSSGSSITAKARKSRSKIKLNKKIYYGR